MKPNIRQLLLRIKTLGSTIGISPIILLLFSAASGCKEQQPKQARVIDMSLYRLRAPEGGNLWAMDNDTIAPDIPVGQRGLITNFNSHFIFHDSLGNIIKVVHRDSFPTRNPIFKLNFPRNTTATDPAYNHFGDFARFGYWDSKTQAIVQVVPKPIIRREFAKLKRYGINIEKPDEATLIYGLAGYKYCSRSPNRKFLCVVEDVSIINEFTEEPERFDENGVLLGDAMFDCSMISVYDHSGKMIKEYLLPGKKCGYSFGISNDGRFVFVGYYKTARSADGYGGGKGGYCMVDLYSNTLEEINDRDLPISSGGHFDEIVFAQDFFRFQNVSIYTKETSSQYYYYINPYTKVLYEPLKVPKTDFRDLIYEDIFEPRRGYRMDTLHQKQLPYYKY